MFRSIITYPFVEELNYLLEHGLAVDDNTININIKGFVVDASSNLASFIKQVKGQCIKESVYLSGRTGSISFPNGTRINQCMKIVAQ
ncbi:Uncharacterized protein FWK35_00002135 [Aphis craccivora]|uniref:Uncharacterized protein n=1 Tax=Aphis craccivora TaxID=307492 RepID=A0A6G0ZFA6_APHCR|nr:Uncharacterized protein FWK35_00002135 [Aphis craccivora]